MARRRERPTPCSPDDTLSWVESRTGQGEEGTSGPGSNDLDGGGDDNSDGQDEEESGSERKQTLKSNSTGSEREGRVAMGIVTLVAVSWRLRFVQVRVIIVKRL